MKQIFIKGLMLLTACIQVLIVNGQKLMYDVVPVQSTIYQKANNILVFTSRGKLSSTSALPVFYMANIQENDSLFYQNLNKMVEEGSMPPMVIVGIYKQLNSPDLTTEENPNDPKNAFTDLKSADDNYFAFIEKEVVPLIEKKYNCSKYKILSSQETNFTNYILKNYTSAFNAYVFEKPFIWVDNKPKFAITSSNNMTTDIYFPEEFYLKYGKKPSWHQE